MMLVMLAPVEYNRGPGTDSGPEWLEEWLEWTWRASAVRPELWMKAI
jgi:hypothetical protein